MANGPGKKFKGLKGAISEKELEMALRNAGGPEELHQLKQDIAMRQLNMRTPSQSSSRLRRQLGMTKNPTTAGTSKFGKFEI
tara:strand:- start:41 stop:286 length:246 start_codon:yes stop_codon:yes gene_type:complete